MEVKVVKEFGRLYPRHVKFAIFMTGFLRICKKYISQNMDYSWGRFLRLDKR